MNPSSTVPAGAGPQSVNGPPKIRRKNVQADPFFRTKSASAPAKRPVIPAHPPKPVANGHPLVTTASEQTSTPRSQRSLSPTKQAIPHEERVSGFSDPRLIAEGIPYKDYKLVTTKRDLLNGLRYHVAHLPADKPVDIRSEADFTKPVRLHRRDPRVAPTSQGHHEHEDLKDGLNAAEREDLTKRKEARQKEREANLAQIAPSSAPGRKVNNFKKKTQQVYRPDYTEEDKRRIQTNYEEKLPWHLEDFDNKHCYVGENQIGSANMHAAFVRELARDGTTSRFRLVPVEKIYHFKLKRDIIPVLTLEEAEAAMKPRGFEPEALTRQREARMAESRLQLEARQSKGLFSGAQVATVAGRNGEEADLDFDDDFADDEEGDLFIDKDEDEKLAEKKIKEDQLQANFLAFKDEKEYDKAEEREKKDAEARKIIGKRYHKALEKREKNYNHASDSDSVGSSSDSEEERERVEQERLAKLARDGLEGPTNLPSSGTSTPSGRKDRKAGRHSDREGGMNKAAAAQSRKRPGSPNLSDASGTDASVRKKKKRQHRASNQPTPNPSRPISPVNGPEGSLRGGSLDEGKLPQKYKSRRPGSDLSSRPGSAAGSDTEAAYSDGAAMSDGTKARRLKLKMTSAPAAPTSQPQVNLGLPTADEIRAAVPPSGISVADLMRTFKARAGDDPGKKELAAIVKTVARLDKETNMLVLR